MRSAAVEGAGRRHLSHVSGANTGCNQDLQVRGIIFIIFLALHWFYPQVLGCNPTTNYSTVSYCDSQYQSTTQSVLSVVTFKDLKIFIWYVYLLHVTMKDTIYILNIQSKIFLQSIADIVRVKSPRKPVRRPQSWLIAASHSLYSILWYYDSYYQNTVL